MTGLLENLAQKLNQTQDTVLLLLRNAPRKYRVYSIPKRTHGRRVIAQPTKELKACQRAFLELYPFPAHQAAMAYRKGIGIRQNALIHKNQRYLLKMDLENFFHSITPKLFWNICAQHPNLCPQFDDEEKRLVTLLLFWSPKKLIEGTLILSIGAPSSPAISNFCLYPFDEELSTWCQEQQIHYSRYADDLTFSTNQPKILSNTPQKVAELLAKFFAQRLTINNSKTVFSSRAHNRHVTGVTINNDAQLSLGRERKRYIKHLVHQFQLGKLTEDEVSSLRGLLSFAYNIEPSFMLSLEKKYSPAVLQQIRNVSQ